MQSTDRRRARRWWLSSAAVLLALAALSLGGALYGGLRPAGRPFSFRPAAVQLPNCTVRFALPSVTEMQAVSVVRVRFPQGGPPGLVVRYTGQGYTAPCGLVMELQQRPVDPARYRFQYWQVSYGPGLQKSRIVRARTLRLTLRGIQVVYPQYALQGGPSGAGSGR